MAKIRATGSIGVQGMNSSGSGSSLFDFSQPAGWAMLFWILSVAFIFFIYFSL